VVNASLLRDAILGARARIERSVRQISSATTPDSVGCTPSSHDGVSMADHSMTGTFKIPQDLLSEAKRSKPKNDRLHVEGWRNSWLSRLMEKLVGHD
jgi:hypothetical protein